MTSPHAVQSQIDLHHNYTHLLTFNTIKQIQRKYDFGEYLKFACFFLLLTLWTSPISVRSSNIEFEIETFNEFLLV